MRAGTDGLGAKPMHSAVEAVAPGLARWQLQRSPKYAASGVVRVISPDETIRRVAPLMKTIGVTRVAEVTGLDRVGIPNFTTVRPRDAGEGISYYNGKGLTRAAAHAGALMEAVERYSGEFCDLPVSFCDRDEMERRGATVDPDEIVVPRPAEYVPGQRIDWVEGFDLLNQRPTYLPLNAVVCPYQPVDGHPMLYYASTNGLASGNTIEEALCHALCEVVERDALAVSDAALDLSRAVAAFFDAIGVRPQQAFVPAVTPAIRRIDVESLPSRALRLTRKMHAAGLLVYLRDVTSPTGIPTLDCTLVERQLDGRHLVHGGSGAHPDARVAVTRALTEAAQSRLAHIQGGREDLPTMIGTPEPFDPEHLYGRGEKYALSTIASFDHPNVDDDIRFMLERLGADRFDQVVAVDLTRPEVGVPVVRVVVPRAETWSVYFTHARRARLGDEANRVLCAAVHGNAG
jgi:ribosomal protein S12 methylthiotransferase accessory factor